MVNESRSTEIFYILGSGRESLDKEGVRNKEASYMSVSQMVNCWHFEIFSASFNLRLENKCLHLELEAFYVQLYSKQQTQSWQQYQPQEYATLKQGSKDIENALLHKCHRLQEHSFLESLKSKAAKLSYMKSRTTQLESYTKELGFSNTILTFVNYLQCCV